MIADDLVRIEELAFFYEQAYVLHRHAELPELFSRDDEVTFDIAGDSITGWAAIRDKFADLAEVSPREDSFHTGWQICTPLIDIDEGSTRARIIAPTFGYLVMNFAPELFSPPYTVRAAFEMWDDDLVREAGVWRIRRLRARFMMGQPVWRWDAGADDTYATRRQMHLIAHPFRSGEGVAP